MTWVYVLIYHLVWLATVMGVSLDIPYLGAIGAGVAIFWHMHSHLYRDRFILLLFSGLGLVVESLQYVAGWVGYPTFATVFWIIPLWMVFGIMLKEVVVKWHLPLFVWSILGAFLGPFAYVCAAKLGGFSVGLAYPIWVMWGALWAMVMPLSILGARK